VFGTLPSAFCQALDKDVFVEYHTWQNRALGNDRVYREQDSRHRDTLGELRRSVKGHQQPSIADGRYLCRVPSFGTRQKSRYRCTVRRALFAECHTRQRFCQVFFSFAECLVD
jgi:hypothetical protein